ncbi:MAG: hypothetical protein EOM07_05535 [Clostridia bacterium]|nr:hypothetical protein [Clostridia bacterium]
MGATFIAAKLAAIPGGKIIALAGAAYIVATAGSIAPAFVSALMRRRGLDITVGWWYGLPQLSFSLSNEFFQNRPEADSGLLNFTYRIKLYKKRKPY